MIDYFEIIHDKVIWGPLLLRQLEDWMVDGWVSLLNLLDTIFVVGRGIDRLIWELDPHSTFSMSSFCKELLKTNEVSAVHPKVWAVVSPLKVKVFGWLAGMQKILTIDSLSLRNMIIVNACPLCLLDAESVNHFFFTVDYLIKFGCIFYTCWVSISTCHLRGQSCQTKRW